MRTASIERSARVIQLRASRRFLFTQPYDIGRLISGLCALLFCALVAGCCPPRPAAPKAYYGPTDSMDTVVREINRNNALIPTLWTQLNYTATLVDPEKRTTTAVAGDGVLMYARPRSLLLNLDKDVAGQVVQLGSNDEEFWVRMRTSADTSDYTWGHYASLGKPGARPVPIRPDLVMEVLGISLYRANFLVQPAPVMRFDNVADAYVFDLNAIADDRWETREEIWYDRVTRLPRKVLLYEADGRVALQADLSEQTAVAVANMPSAQWPSIARHYDLLFPDSGTRISFDFLNEPETRHAGRRGVMLPNTNSFERPDPDASDRLIPIDPANGE